MSSDVPLDPIAQKLREAVARSKQEKDAATGEHLLKADFEAYARQAAPDEFTKLAKLLRERGALLNTQMPAEIHQELHYEPVNHVLEAGNFAVQLQPLEGLKEYSVTVSVGLHPKAAQFTDPEVVLKTVVKPVRRSGVPLQWEVRATADENGFFWVDTSTNHRRSPPDIIEDALESLTKLLAANFKAQL